MRFCHLTDNDRFAKASWDSDKIELRQVTCPLNPMHKRGGERLTDLSITLKSPRIGEFVWTWYSECLITEKVAELFAQHSLTGYHLSPVSVSKIKRGDPNLSKLPKLWELKLTGWAGMAGKGSGIRLVESCGGCGHLRYSGCSNVAALIDSNQWDGSDFFMVWPLPVFIFVSERVRDVILKAKLTGCQLIPVEHMPIHAHVGTPGFSPGRLSGWMPEDRARELGEPLGIF